MNIQSSWQRLKRACRRKDGLTLVELMAVTMVMAIIAGIVLGIAGYASRRADESRAQANLQVLRTLLDAYRLEYGQYPSEALSSWDGSDEETVGWANIFGPVDLKDTDSWQPIDWRDHVDAVRYFDPWGRPYHYARSGRFSFDLFSHGPTGAGNTADRIH